MRNSLLLATALFTSVNAETLISDEFLLRVLLKTGAASQARNDAARRLVNGPPGAGVVTTPGAVAATTCIGTCTKTGGVNSGNYMTRTLTQDSKGIFSGTLTTNACPNHAGSYQYGGVTDAKVSASTAVCQTWTLPVTGYTTFPIAAPLRGSIGYTISGGESIYGEC